MFLVQHEHSLESNLLHFGFFKSRRLKVHSTTARVDADVVPHTVHRRYHADGSYLEGVAMRSNGKVIYNWPNQDYANGVDKNANTSRNYKAMVRILKNLRGEMEGNGIFAARGVQSYLIACLVWNVPNPYLTGDTYAKMLEDSLVFLSERTSDLNNVVEWGEVNELKYLFRTSQPWTMESAHNFVTAAAAYLRSLKQ